MLIQVSCFCYANTSMIVNATNAALEELNGTTQLSHPPGVPARRAAWQQAKQPGSMGEGDLWVLSSCPQSLLRGTQVGSGPHGHGAETLPLAHLNWGLPLIVSASGWKKMLLSGQKGTVCGITGWVRTGTSHCFQWVEGCRGVPSRAPTPITLTSLCLLLKQGWMQEQCSRAFCRMVL